MSLAKSFEELEMWKLAREIVKDIYKDFAHIISILRGTESRNHRKTESQ